MNAELHPFPQKSRMANAITLPCDLSCEPPIQPRDRSKRPWSEVAAVYKILATLRGISSNEQRVGPSLREWSSMFEWGSNGHKLLAKLIDRLGLQCIWDRTNQKSVWCLKNTQVNTHGNTQPKQVVARVGEIGKTRPKTQGSTQATKRKPNSKPKKTPQRKGFQQSQVPSDKPSLAYAGEECLGSGLGRIKNLNSPSPEHKAFSIQFSEAERQVRDHVLEDFREIQMRLKPEFVRDWFDRIGVEAFTALWDRIRVCNFEDPIQTYPGFIFGAVKAFQRGHAGWVQNANPLWRVNPQLEWMRPIKVDWFEVGNQQEKSTLGIHQTEPPCEKRKRIIADFCKKENIPRQVTENFSLLDLDRIRASIAAYLIANDRWTATEIAQVRADAMEEYSIALKDIPDDDPLVEAVFHEVLLADIGFPWLE